MTTLLKLVALVGLLLLGFWLRLDKLDSLPPGLSNDEAVNTVDSFHLARTGNFPIYDDPNPPEPLHRIILAFNQLFFGTSVWAFRMTSVFAGVLSIAAAYWAMTEALHDVPRQPRRIASLAASASLTVAVGHITVSRIIERGVLQPLFMLLLLGFLLRGLRTGKYHDFAFAGILLGLLIYTYTAALIIPLTLLPSGLSLLIFRRKMWRKWMPRLIVAGVICIVMALPVVVRLLETPTAVLGRAGDVRAGAINLGSAVNAMSHQFFVAGDENPQYNADSAPLLPPSFRVFFIVGLIGLLIRIRQPSSAVIGAFLIFAAIPVIASNEITHGLRIVGEYAVFPLVIGIGVAFVLVVCQLVLDCIPRQCSLSSILSLGWVHTGVLGILAVIVLADATYAHQVYVEFWDKPYMWFIHERNLQHGEWFYRTDRRDLARWIASQDSPLLVPLDELNVQTTRTWLMPVYNNIPTTSNNLTIPLETRLVVPWSLELRDLRRETRHYVLLNDGDMTILPPFSVDTYKRLLEGIDDAEAITRENGSTELIARVKEIPSDIEFTFEPQTVSGQPIAVFGENELQLMGWRGPDTLSTSGSQTLIYTLDWQGLTRMGHKYSAFVQLLTQDFQPIAGDDVRILEWLYPTSAWRAGDIVPDVHSLTISGELQPGAYRLVAGVYPFVTLDKRLQVLTPTGEPANDSLTLGWLKVPQREMLVLGEGVAPIEATIGDFTLIGAEVTKLEGNQILVSLYWKSQVERRMVDATIFVHVVDETDTNVAQQDERPWGGQYPTFIWGKDEIVRTDYIVDIEPAAMGELSLKVGMYALPSVDRFPVVQNGQPVADGRVILGNIANLLQP
jgi:hypothetical protein